MSSVSNDVCGKEYECSDANVRNDSELEGDVENDRSFTADIEDIPNTSSSNRDDEGV